MIPNPKGAFGYSQTDGLNQTRGLTKYAYVHNMSTVAIPRYSAVCLSSLSQDGTGVIASTVIGSRLFLGVLQWGQTASDMSSQASTATTASSAVAPGEWGVVAVEGPCIAAITTGAAPGDVLTNGNSTVGGGNALQPHSTAVPGTAGAIGSAAGWCLSTATTGTTGFLSTTQPRGVVYLRPCFFFSATA
jgi:hypothetical protein